MNPIDQDPAASIQYLRLRARHPKLARAARILARDPKLAGEVLYALPAAAYALAMCALLDMDAGQREALVALLDDPEAEGMLKSLGFSAAAALMPDEEDNDSKAAG
jgi:hypothetical protein